MAISPDLLNQKFLKDVSLTEQELDRRLSMKSIDPGGSVTIDAPSGMTSKQFPILRNRYIEAGWKEVVWESDQREGDWLVFKS